MQHKVSVCLLTQACSPKIVIGNYTVIGWMGEELGCESHIGLPASVLTHQRDTSTPKATEAEAKEKTPDSRH